MTTSPVNYHFPPAPFKLCFPPQLPKVSKLYIFFASVVPTTAYPPHQHSTKVTILFQFEWKQVLSFWQSFGKTRFVYPPSDIVYVQDVEWAGDVPLQIMYKRITAVSELRERFILKLCRCFSYYFSSTLRIHGFLIFRRTDAWIVPHRE